VGAAVLLLPTTIASAQDRVIYPGTGHVPELERYLDHVEIYAPVVHRRLAVFPVRLRPGERLGGDWLTMDDALSRGVLVVTEKHGGGQVPVVVVENRSRSDHVFIMSGELLAGGKQTRTVRRDAVLSPGQRIELSVFCVEARRWQGQSRLKAGSSLLPQSIQQSLRSGADQQRIWSEVARNNRALNAENPTDSLETALNSRGVRAKLEGLRSRLIPQVPRDSVGFIFVDRGRAAGADFFGRPDLAAALLPKLLDAYCVDLILKQPGDSRPGGGVQQEVAIAFFERLRRAGSQRWSTPGSGAGIRLRAGGLLGDGVSLTGTVVHFGVQTGRRIVPLRD
jgi:hypothetical protein